MPPAKKSTGKPRKGVQSKPVKKPAANGLVMPRVEARLKKGAANIALDTGERQKPGKGSKGGRPTAIGRKVAADYARAARMFMLRATGATYDECGASEGISGSQAFRIMDSHVKNMHVEGATTVKLLLVQELNSLLAVHHEAAHDLDHPSHYSAVDRVLACIDRIAKIMRVEEATFEDDMTGIPEGGAKLVLGLTRDEYMTALKRVEARQNATIYDDPDDRPDDIEIEEAEVVDE